MQVQGGRAARAEEDHEQVVVARLVDPRIPAQGADEAARARTVADYVAGMTDRFALDEIERLSDPRRLP